MIFSITTSWTQMLNSWKSFTSTTEAILKRWKVTAWLVEKFERKFKQERKKPKLEEESNNFLHNGLDSNINMPTTGDEAMKRYDRVQIIK